jgi:hypothetical protein
MSAIVISNGDSQIWHKEQVIVGLVKLILDKKPFTVNLNSEGPCATSLGLYNLLDMLCDQFSFNPTNITIVTCNQLEAHHSYRIIKHPPFKGVASLKMEFFKKSQYKTVSEKTKHFGNFVSRGNRMRLTIASLLYYKHRNKTLQSYHTDVTNPYFDHHVGLEDSWFNGYDAEMVKRSFDFLNVVPIKVDPVNSYPIFHGPTAFNILNFYQDFFVDIVNHPYFSGNTFYVDEKIWRPIITKTPFIVQGPRNFLSNLKRLGFKTFDCWWDEGYSEDPSDYQVKLILEVIDQISAKSCSELAIMYEEMKPVLDHNYNCFMSLKESDFRVFK